MNNLGEQMAFLSEVYTKYEYGAAVADLVGAAGATVATQLIGGSFSLNAFPRDLLVVGGTAIMAYKVSDILSSRVEQFIVKERPSLVPDTPYVDYATRGAISGVAAYGLLWASGSLGAQAFSAKSLVPALIIGASGALGLYVTAEAAIYYAKQKAKKGSK